MVLVDIGLSAWIIQDGNYGDFAVGDEARFALEFGIVSLAKPQKAEPNLRLVRGAEYDFDGRVAHSTAEFAILDAGILVYRDGGGAPSPALAADSRLSGRLYLGIDPFCWFEHHGKRPDVPNLFHRWILREILLETTPWIEDPTGRFSLVRATNAVSFTSVPKTDAWNDDAGRAHYILRAERLGAG